MSFHLNQELLSKEKVQTLPTEDVQPEPIQEQQPEQPVEVQESKPEPTPVQDTYDSPAAKNFRALREQKEKIERERDEYRKKVQEYEAMKIRQEPEEEEVLLGPDDLAEGKHLSKVQKEVKKLKEQLKAYQHQSQEISAETRLKSQYPDFDKVVTQETIEQFKYNHPELFNTISTSQTDLYNKGVAAYTMMKKLGIVPEQTYNADKERIQANAAKPRPLAAVSPQQGDSPLSRANAFANGLTEDLKKQLYKEMLAARNS